MRLAAASAAGGSRASALLSCWLGLVLLVVAWFWPDWLPPRLGDLFASGGTGGQRLLFWQATFDLFAHEPGRLLAGLGPDALAFKLAPYLPATVAHFEVDWAFRIPDRAHTYPLDLLATGGILSLGLTTVLWAILMARLVSGNDKVVGQRHASGGYAVWRWLPVVLPIVGAVGLAAVAIVAAGWPAAPLGFSAGLLGGLLVALILCPAGALSPIAPFLLAALAGHWLLMAFSFPTHGADVLLWPLLGLTLAVTSPAEGSAPAVMAPSPPPLNLYHVAGAAAAAFGFSLSAALPYSLAALDQRPALCLSSGLDAGARGRIPCGFPPGKARYTISPVFCCRPFSFFQPCS